MIGAFTATARGFGADSLIADHHYIEASREIAGAQGINVQAGPGGAQGKEKTYIAFRDALREGVVSIPNGNNPIVQRLIGQLRNVTSKAQPGGGLSISSPRRSGAHGDLVSALVLAFWHSRTAEGTFVLGPEWSSFTFCGAFPGFQSGGAI